MEEEAEEDLEKTKEFYFATHITCLRHNTGTDDDDNVFYSSIVTNNELFKILKELVLLQAWSGPEGSRKLIFPVFMTTAQDGGKVASLTHQPPLPPGKTPGTHFC